MNHILGIDVGATGTKAGIVDLQRGELISERLKIQTPESKLPGDMIEVMAELISEFKWKGKPVGIGFPAIIKQGVSCSASNIDDSWIGFPIHNTIKKKIKCPLSIVNDADAAGIAEMTFGAGKDVDGTVILLTLGTGIGSAVFRDGVLIPNTEFGHLHYKDNIAEKYASNSARKMKNLSWDEFGEELNGLLEHIDFIFSPDLLILGGGISKKFTEYANHFSEGINVVPARALNSAGIIGAALWYDRANNS